MPLTAAQIEFTYPMFPFRYSEVVDISNGNNKLFFARQESGAAYSELHMAAGECAILQLSQAITQLNGALVLIDDIEAGLDSSLQRLLMFHLQQLALRNDLQIIVTSHSPVILETVPSNGKIFLDRDDASGKVVARPAYRDLMQNAIYGRFNETLKLLCEDDITEDILKGIFDLLLPQERINWELVHTGCTTGASEFPRDARVLANSGQIQDTVFILNGDQRGGEIEGRIREAAGRGVNISILFLPGGGTPESWVWDRLKHIPDTEIQQLGINRANLSDAMNRLDVLYDSASESSSEIAKIKLRNLSEKQDRGPSEICRIVARLEADRQASDIQPFVGELREILRQWRR